MKWLAHLTKLGAEMGQYAAISKAQKDMDKKRRRDARRAARNGEPPSEGCTPCAAKKRGVEMVEGSGVWK